MSINMTQELCFETDDLDSFEIMLRAAVTVLFRFSGQHISPHIRIADPGHWEDGKDYGAEFDSQPSFVDIRPILKTACDMLNVANAQLASRECYALVDSCATYGGASQLLVQEIVKNKDEAARKCCKQRTITKPTRKWVCMISDYKGDLEGLAKEKRICCPSKDDLITSVMTILRAIDYDEAMGWLGDLEPSWFDGSVGVGYRMEWQPNGGWNHLHISLVLAMYGK